MPFSSERSWTLPVRAWNPTQRRVVALGLMAVTMAIAILVGSRWPHGEDVPDAEKYVALASGNVSQVMQPFASRQLGPLVAHELSVALHIPVTRAFTVQGIVSILTISGIVYGLLLWREMSRWFLPAFVLLPFWPSLYQDVVLPDVFYAALLALVLLLLWKEQVIAAAFMMFPLMVARESTWLTLVCLLIAAWKPLRWTGRLVAVAAAAAGAAVVRHLSALALPNQEHLSPLQYLAGKALWNGIRAVGILPWSNVYPLLCAQPRWQMELHLGPVTTVGLCGVSVWPVASLLASAFSVFGLLPLVVFCMWRSRPADAAEYSAPLVRFCLVYGASCFLLAPFLGTSTGRLFGYAWPLMLMGLPAIWNRKAEGMSDLHRVLILGIHCGLFLLALGGDLISTTVATIVLGSCGVVVLQSAFRLQSLVE